MRHQLGRLATGIGVAARVFVRSRSAFLLAMIILAAARLLFSTFEPASYDLRDMIIVPPSQVLGPWMALEVGIFGAWQSLTAETVTPLQWSMIPPPDMSANMRLLSLLLRLPAFGFNSAIAAVLYFAVVRLASKETARLTSLLWYINPYTVFTSELLAVPDVAVAFFTLCVVVSLLNRRPILGSALFAVSVALKLYPILLLPAFLIYITRRMAAKTRTKAIMLVAGVIGLAGYIGWAYPNWVPNLFLFEYTPVTQTLSLYTPYQLLAVRVSAATVFLVALYFAMWRFAHSSQVTDYILPVLLVYYTFSLLYPQYLIWALPFLVLDIVLVRRRHASLLVLLLSLVFLDWFFESVGLPTPSGYSMLLFPLAGKNLPWVSQALISFLKAGIMGTLLFPILETAVYATTLIYALEIARGWFFSSQPHVSSE